MLSQRSVSVSIQVGFPKNMRNTFGIVKILQSTSEISQVPVSIDAIPDGEGGTCLPMELHSFRATTLLRNRHHLSYVTITVGIMRESNSVTGIQIFNFFHVCVCRCGFPLVR